MKRFSLLCFWASALSFVCLSQTSEARQDYESFKNQATARYGDFREKANDEYARFVEKAWKWYDEGVVFPKPKDDMLPPVVREDDAVIPEDSAITIEEIVDVPSPAPQPVPNFPIGENPVADDSYVSVDLYGMDIKVRFPKEGIVIRDSKEKTIASAWRELSGEGYNNTIRDCLENRIRYNLSDWSFLRMIDAVCSKRFGKSSNEAELVKAYIFSQSGYKMKLAVADGKILMLYGTPYMIHNKLAWAIDGDFFYCDIDNIERIYVCQAKFPGEQSMSFDIRSQQYFTVNISEERNISNGAVSAKSFVNKNYIDFCSDYPSSQYGKETMTRWAIYANAPTTREMQENLYPQLGVSIQGKSSFDAVNILCTWIQTAFEYDYDENIWGHDRAFFADETLYYPYCDCEDRSILLTRIVRDLLGLECALVYYPGHLATAIALGEDAKGDYIRIDGKKYLICDPTYINAPIGFIMPGMDRSSAQVILLQSN